METQNHQKEDYNSLPVRYCSKCYSLRIGYIQGADNSDYCESCGCSDIAETSIEEWEKLYEERYGHPYIQKDNTYKNSKASKVSIFELKRMLYHSPYFRAIVFDMYPSLPSRMDKPDLMMMFFDKVSKDNRIEELRYLLYTKQSQKKH